MPLPEQTLAELSRLAREDEALEQRLPPELSTPISAEKTAALVGAIHGKLGARTRRRNFLAAGGAVAAMAAGVAVFFTVGRDGKPLPLYEARVEGGQQSERSSAPHNEVLRLRAGSKLRFELRPQSDFPEPVRARVQILGAGKNLELDEQRSPAGALKLEVRLPASLPERGEIVVTVEGASSSPGTQRFSWPFERSP
ncbi:MAG: hypothetical protein M3020_20230 [Myxococcota bacterium]|jgi:hypothetical protein|nr:hypothetical protein [Myxococcota bacterium]